MWHLDSDFLRIVSFAKLGTRILSDEVVQYKYWLHLDSNILCLIILKKIKIRHKMSYYQLLEFIWFLRFFKSCWSLSSLGRSFEASSSSIRASTSCSRCCKAKARLHLTAARDFRLLSTSGTISSRAFSESFRASKYFSSFNLINMWNYS